jgi:CHASE3 domain sensor protein
MSRLSIWRRIPLRVQSLVLNSLPLLVVLFTAAFAYFSNLQRERMELSLNRHFEMVENLFDIHVSLLSAEAAVRGSVATHDAALLQPLMDARTVIPHKLDQVRTLMQSIPKENRRVDKLAKLEAIRAQLEIELQSLGTNAGGNPSGAAASAEILQDAPRLATVSQQLDALRASEQRLLSRRIDEIRAVRQRDYLLIFLSAFVGLVSRAVALYFFHRRVVRRVRQLTENVRRLRDGATLVHEPSDHADDIGELERELARASEFLAERRVGS